MSTSAKYASEQSQKKTQKRRKESQIDPKTHKGKEKKQKESQRQKINTNRHKDTQITEKKDKEI